MEINNKNILLKLIDKYLEGKTSSEEEELLVNYYESFQTTSEWTEELGIKESIKEKILLKIEKTINEKDHSDKKIIQLTSSYLLKYAAIFIGIIGLSYFYIQSLEKEANLIISDEIITLQLEDGKMEYITSDGQRAILNKKGEVVGTQKGEKLSYHNKNQSEALAESEEVAYNQLTIPYGKTFELVLSDGTVVSLNAGTSLKYPVKFIKGETRQVYLNGEAFFNVAKDETDSFVVNVNDINVRVLGTQFNISSYPEEQHVNTVLVEGSVRLFKKGEVYSPKNSTLLKPGQKAAWDKTEKRISIENVDTSIYTSWKDGQLKFKEIHFNDILKKLERRYDVSFTNNYKKLEEVQYTGTFDIENIDQVLEVFSRYASFTYIKKDQTIIINQPLKQQEIE